MQVNSNWKSVAPLRRGWKPNSPVKPLDLLNRAPIFFANMIQSKYKFCQWCLSWNKLKWAQMSSKSFIEPNSIQMSSNEPKWVYIGLYEWGSLSTWGVEASPATLAHLWFNIYYKECLSPALGYDSSTWWFNLNKIFSKDARTQTLNAYKRA